MLKVVLLRGVKGAAKGCGPKSIRSGPDNKGGVFRHQLCIWDDALKQMNWAFLVPKADYN